MTRVSYWTEHRIASGEWRVVGMSPQRSHRKRRIALFRGRLRISTIYLYRVSIPPRINLKSQIKSMTRMTFLENTFIEFLIVK